MDVFMARQPIFDRQMNIYGYELLYRSSHANHFDEIDDDLATADLICNSFTVVGLNNLTDGTRAFINFSKSMLDSDIPLLLPKNDVVLEILEREQATQATVDACNRARSLGYTLALDDYVINDSFLPLIHLVDIVKIEYPSIPTEHHQALVRHFKRHLSADVRLLAEKIETREDYYRAVDLGYDYFQGYFFSKPAIVQSREIAVMQVNLFHIMEELCRPDPQYAVITEIIKEDLGLSYKLMTLANSAYIGSHCRISSIAQALAFIGTKELYQWISMLMLRELKSVENAEIIKLSMIRGRFMELLSQALDPRSNSSECFITGMFSFIDVLLNRPMKDILSGLPFTDDVRQALLGTPNRLNRLLHCVKASEKADWKEVTKQPVFRKIGAARYTALYLDAIKWTRTFDEAQLHQT